MSSDDNNLDNEISSSDEELDININQEEYNQNEENNYEEYGSEYFNDFNIENNVVSINSSDIFNNLNNNSYNLFDSFIYGEFENFLVNTIFERLEEQLIEEVMETSLNETKTLEKTDEFVNFDKQKYDIINYTMKQYNECSICLTEFSNDSEVSVTKCKHVFHNECIVEWSKYKKDCPVCRKNLIDIENNEINQINNTQI